MTDEFGNQKQKIAEKVKIAGISGVKMVIDHGKNKNRCQSTNAEQCLPEKKICITDSNYPVRGNVPCVSASYGTDYLYCAGECME